MAKSMFEIARDKNDLQEVPMNGVGYLRFGSQGKTCLGNQSLNGCTAVVLVSRRAAILGHFSPRPSEQKPNEATGDAHMREMMKRLLAVLGQHFGDIANPPGSKGVIAYAVYSGSIAALKSQKDIVDDQFRKWKMPVMSIPYTVLEDSSMGGPAKGTLLIDLRGETPVVYVEDKLIFDTKDLGSSNTASSTTGSSAVESSKASSR